jgi:plasmid stabilization system protein ParE
VKGYVLAPAAVEDLDEIWLHIARDSIDAAERVLDELEAACALLAERPHAGHIREDLADASVRFWSVRSYLVVYRPDRIPLEIVRFWHGARGTQNLL